MICLSGYHHLLQNLINLSWVVRLNWAPHGRETQLSPSHYLLNSTLVARISVNKYKFMCACTYTINEINCWKVEISSCLSVVHTHLDNFMTSEDAKEVISFYILFFGNLWSMNTTPKTQPNNLILVYIILLLFLNPFILYA